jgi:hypothetical protein
MWHDGKSAADQCEGCSFFNGHVTELVCYLREGERVYETYWTTGRSWLDINRRIGANGAARNVQ